jgi:brefeldin A-inhibited guanine nucleotide-exchange protein
MLQRLCQDPQALVEIYLNYDCDASAVENVYERIVGVVSKQAGAHTAASSKSTSGASGSSVHSPTQPGSARSGQHSIPPSLTTTATTLSDPAADASGAAGLERKLQMQSLESLVFVLRSLVAWKDAVQAKSNNAAAGTTISGSGPQAQAGNSPLSAGMSNGYSLSTDGVRSGSRTSSDGRPSDVAGRLSNVSGGGSVDLRAGGSGSGTGSITPITERDGPIEDDPDRFEVERIRKMTMAEGLRLFNSKPKKV